MKLTLITLLILVFFSCKKENIPENHGEVVLEHWCDRFTCDSSYLVSSITIPNSFTPDGDGYNDRLMFKFHNIDPDTYQVKIYAISTDEIVYKSTHLENNWDGTFLGTDPMDGTYLLHLKAKDYTGYEYDYVGYIQVLR